MPALRSGTYPIFDVYISTVCADNLIAKPIEISLAMLPRQRDAAMKLTDVHKLCIW